MTRLMHDLFQSLIVFLLLSSAHDACAQGKMKPQVRSTPDSGPTAADNTGAYTVIQYGPELKIVREGVIEKLKKQSEDNYKADMKSWQVQKDAAAKENSAYTMKAPTKKEVKVVKGGFKTSEEAEKFKVAKLEELNKKKDAPPPGGKG